MVTHRRGRKRANYDYINAFCARIYATGYVAVALVKPYNSNSPEKLWKSGN